MATREFQSTDHLNPEAIAAFVDGELSDSAFHRAAKHLDACDECRAEVDSQRKAANRLRVVDDSDVRAPAPLVERLAGLCADDLEDGAAHLPGGRGVTARRSEAARATLGKLGSAVQSTVQASVQSSVQSPLKSMRGAIKRRGE